MVIVSVSETYDLSTKTNKMSLIGIHTPKSDLIKKNYPGLLVNCKYFRIVSQDVGIACASMLPADPQQIGTEAGDIAPEDMFNPILYKAVSNDSMSAIESRIHTLNNGLPSLEGNQAVVENSTVCGGDASFDEFPVYYSLLASKNGFRKASPQQGLTMTGLRPLVFETLSSVGISKATYFSSSQQFPAVQATESGVGLNTSMPVGIYRGNAKPMPRLPTTILTGATSAGATRGVEYQANGIGDGAPQNFENDLPPLPPVFTAAIIIPPSRLHRLYYRMVVKTYLEFSEIRPVSDVTSIGDLAALAQEVYYSDYEDLSKRFESTLSSVDADNVDIKQVM